MIHRSVPKPQQFGYVYLGKGFFLDINPLWFLRGRWAWKWDTFYRCKLLIPYIFHHLEQWRFNKHDYRETMNFWTARRKDAD